MARPKSTNKPSLDEVNPFIAAPSINAKSALNNNSKKPDLSGNSGDDEDFTKELISQLNKEAGEKVAYNLDSQDSPVNVKRWIPFGVKQLDYIISNRSPGGAPEGRIIEIQGPPSIGKTHLAYELVKQAQRMGGIGVYFDSEFATSLEDLIERGLHPTRTVLITEQCMETVFERTESTILKTRTMKKDVPVVIVWDSIAAMVPKAELEATYEQNTIGLAARTISKGLRKMAGVIANKNVLLVVINQQRTKIGVMYGDPTTTPGGAAMNYYASCRIKLSAGQPIKKTVEGKEIVIGINVTAKTIKNKVARPFREVDFEIHFGKGLVEYEQVFDYLREWCDRHKDSPFVHNGKRISISGTAAWKNFTVSDNSTGEIERDIKFYKSDFGSKVLYNPEVADYIGALMDGAYIMKPDQDDHTTYAGADLSNPEEVKELKRLQSGKEESLDLG